MNVKRDVRYRCDEGAVTATQDNEVRLERSDPDKPVIVFDGQGAYDLGMALIAGALDASYDPTQGKGFYEDAILLDLRELQVID